MIDLFLATMTDEEFRYLIEQVGFKRVIQQLGVAMQDTLPASSERIICRCGAAMGMIHAERCSRSGAVNEVNICR